VSSSKAVDRADQRRAAGESRCVVTPNYFRRSSSSSRVTLRFAKLVSTSSAKYSRVYLSITLNAPKSPTALRRVIHTIQRHPWFAADCATPSPSKCFRFFRRSATRFPHTHTPSYGVKAFRASSEGVVACSMPGAGFGNASKNSALCCGG
jgi:hypothetical protein